MTNLEKQYIEKLKELIEELSKCPNCGVIWGFDEMQFQECDCCGWPDCDDYNEINEWEE